MLDHRMRAVGTELADHAQHHRLGLRALEFDLALAQISFDAIELAEKVVVPEGAAELAVGHRSQPHLRLLFDDRGDLAVFDRAQLVSADLATLALGARVLQRGRTQQAADVVGAERWCGAGHDLHPSPPRKRGPIFQSRWLWVPACAGTTPSVGYVTPPRPTPAPP